MCTPQAFVQLIPLIAVLTTIIALGLLIVSLALHLFTDVAVEAYDKYQRTRRRYRDGP